MSLTQTRHVFGSVSQTGLNNFLTLVLHNSSALIGVRLSRIRRRPEESDAHRHIAGVTGLLGPILTLFVAGLTFPIYHHSQVQEALPAAGPNDPEVDITILTLDAVVQQTDKSELVISASIAA